MLELILLILGTFVAAAPGEAANGNATIREARSALVIAVRGEVTSSPNTRAEQSLMQPLDTLKEGEVIRMGKNSRLDLLFDHRWLSFVGNGDIRLQRNRWVHPGSIRRIRAREMPDTLPTDGLDRWSSAPEVGEANGLAIESPRETAIRDYRPTLRWRASRPPQTVRLDLLAVIDGRLETVESWRGVSARELRVHRPLEPERLYFWRVADERAGHKTAAQAWFLVRGPGKIQALDAWVRSLEELRSSDDEDRHVAESLLAVGLERAGLLEEARSSWRALASQGRILDMASKRSARLERRILTEPREHPIVPLPFQMRLHLKREAPGEESP